MIGWNRELVAGTAVARSSPATPSSLSGDAITNADEIFGLPDHLIDDQFQHGIALPRLVREFAVQVAGLLRGLA